MKKLFKVLAAFSLLISVAGINSQAFATAQSRENPNYGRIQIQGPDITANYSKNKGEGTISEPWNQLNPPTKKEGRQLLAKLENQLNDKQKQVRKKALQQAIDYINNCPVKGCLSEDIKSWPGSSYRVDIEIRVGAAFTGEAPKN